RHRPPVLHIRWFARRMPLRTPNKRSSHSRFGSRERSACEASSPGYQAQRTVARSPLPEPQDCLPRLTRSTRLSERVPPTGEQSSRRGLRRIFHLELTRIGALDVFGKIDDGSERLGATTRA